MVSPALSCAVSSRAHSAVMLVSAMAAASAWPRRSGFLAMIAALMADPEHRVTDGAVSDARADRADHARKVAAQDIGEPKMRATASQPHFVIGRVDTGGVNIDYHLARPGSRGQRLAVA